MQGRVIHWSWELMKSIEAAEKKAKLKSAIKFTVVRSHGGTVVLLEKKSLESQSIARRPHAW